MLLNKPKIFFSFILVLTLNLSFAHAERRLMSVLEGNWMLEKVRVLGNDTELANSGYLTISGSKDISYQGLCKSYEGQIFTSEREVRKRSKKRGRSYKFNAGFKLIEIPSGDVHCLGFDEFEANIGTIFRARFLNRQSGTLKLRTKNRVFTFRKL